MRIPESDTAGEPRAAFGALMGAETMAAYLDISSRSIWALVATGDLPQPISPPGTRRRLWRRDEVDEAIAKWKSAAA